MAFDAGNGNRHRTPSPGGLRKIKIISFKAFLDLKEFFNNFKGRELIFLRDSTPLIKDLEAGIHLPWPVVNEKQIKHDSVTQTLWAITRTVPVIIIVVL